MKAMQKNVLALITLVYCMAVAPMPALGKAQGANLIASSQTPVHSIAMATSPVMIAKPMVVMADAALNLPISYAEPATKNSQAIAKATAAAVFDQYSNDCWK
jgi:hypothetical protein